MPIPKSLHTVRVLTIVGHLCKARATEDGKTVTAESACKAAAAILGYSASDDDYGLIAKATAQLDAGA
jgi:hypothetical protein